MNYKRFFNVIYDDKGRRHWRANDPEPEQKKKEEPEKKKLLNIDYTKALEARQEDSAISKSVGTVKFDKNNKDAEKLLGYYCKMCDFTGRDNLAWLDHLNSESHNRNLGNHMKVEKVTVDAVANHLNNLNHKKNKKPPPKIEDILKRLEEGQPVKKQKTSEEN